MELNDIDRTYYVTVNAGSSSIKLAMFTDRNPRKLWEASVENIGQPSVSFVVGGVVRSVEARTHNDAARLLLEQLTSATGEGRAFAVGHRIVHGGVSYHKSTVATNEVLDDLRRLSDFDPEHLPIELELVDVFQKALPGTQQILCFDTAFHHALPTYSRLLPVPRFLEAKGIRRYGFHGLSYAYVVNELHRVEGEAAANGKVIIAHLGSGASLTVLKGGSPVDTTMSMTPASGIPMSTRSGDLDPGLMFYLTRTLGYDTERVHHMVNFESGLLGISETTADMEQLLSLETGDSRAKEAIDIFCYNVTKTIGGFAASIGGLNTLVFTGGMGENAPKIRARICERLAFLGISLDDMRNQKSERLISIDGGLVGVHVIHTDEASTIAREMDAILHKNIEGGDE